MNASWNGRHSGWIVAGSTCLHDAHALLGRLGHGPVGDLEGVEALRIGQQGDAPLDAIRGNPGQPQQFLGRVLPPLGRLRHLGLLGGDPLPVLGHEPAELRPGVVRTGEVRQGLHRQRRPP